MNIPEDFLHYLWRIKRFDFSDLKTTQEEAITLIEMGTHNHDAGPDFLNAKIKIGETIWGGNVEMHLISSDWIKHKHNHNRAYDNVILHVVMEEDKPIFRTNGTRIPTLELRKRIPPKLVHLYQKLIHNEYWIPCQHQFNEVSEFSRTMWLDRMLIERLERKTTYIYERLVQNDNNWEATFYQFVARNFGVKVNAEPFEVLAKSMPLLTLAKHKNNLFQIEALLFGQAGFLESEFDENYPNDLKKEYDFLKKKYRLSPIPRTMWNFLRLRPANFPTIRLAQFATLIFQSTHLFSKILEVETVKEIEQLFEIKLSDYWLTHYVFDKTSKKRNKSLGKTTIQLLIINTIAPFLFLYGSLKQEEKYRDKALTLLETLPAEKNRIIKKWVELGVESKTAYQTQALIQLKNEYCTSKKCLDCAIGNAILKK